MRSGITSLLAVFVITAVTPAQKPGLTRHTLESGGKAREYLLHIPKGFSKKSKTKLPLVVMLHGRTSNGKAAASSYYGWRPLADREKFVVAFPTALGRPTSWQGAWRGKPSRDSTFLAALIDHLVKDLGLDEKRVFMTGHSSGGFMSYSFAATQADKVAAIGPVAGLMIGKPTPKVPVSVISFHGMADRVVAYDDTHGKNAAFNGMPSAKESAAGFAKACGCGKPKEGKIAKGKVKVTSWEKGKRNTRVVLYSIVDGDHGWPRKRSHHVGASEMIWEFFKEHARKPPAKVGSKSP